MVVDAEAAVRAFINSRTGDLVGVGHPLQLGAFLNRQHSPGRGAYAYLTRVGGVPTLTVEQPVDQARISAAIYAPTKLIAARAATAYASLLHTLSLGGTRTPMGEAVCLTVDNISGPLLIDDSESNHEQFRYLVDADFLLADPALI
ncbi:hypothetical protein [Actinomadura litoris]|uniref:Uncharacterized protein n=1 Tax=Actinomadura litoris TaxID=2678616 RepID=A0A7K1LAR2_9ACTN|nr:hypothetical protein [Actinomadura litoris]MUN41403.1 hypothetical protein [Actinomadura litoris]